MKKKILIFSDCFIFGGCEIVLTNLVNSKLINNDFEIIYSYRKFQEYDDKVNSKVDDKNLLLPIRLFSNDTYIYKLSLKKAAWYNTLLKYFLIFFSKIGIYQLLNFFILLRFFRKIKPDIIFINNGGYPGSNLCRLAVFSAKFSNVDNILFNVNNLAFASKGFFDSQIDILINKFVHTFITASEAAKKRLSEVRGFPLNKILTFSNCVEEKQFQLNNSVLRDEFNIGNDVIIIGAVGLLTKRKGFSILLDSLKILIDKNSKITISVFIIGEGEDRNLLEEKIIALGLKNYVNLIGFRSDVLNYVKDFDIFILPSISNEDMPYVIVEAMMLKKPVIASRVAGTPEEVLDGETGIIVTPSSSKELADAIYLLVNNIPLRLNYGLKGYERYHQYFRYDVIMKKYRDFFHSL